MIRKLLKFEGCRQVHGFTLTEVLVVTSLIGILAATSFSMLADWHRKEKLKAAHLAVFHLLQQTRVQAIIRARVWSTQDTLTSEPYSFSEADALLSTFAQRMAETDKFTISVSENSVAFDARGRRTTQTSSTITISAPDMDPRSIEVDGSGKIKIMPGVG
jgi:prepilin-type N-terminal cleavage/methylation domain-containing protein